MPAGLSVGRVMMICAVTKCPLVCVCVQGRLWPVLSLNIHWSVCAGLWWPVLSLKSHRPVGVQGQVQPVLSLNAHWSVCVQGQLRPALSLHGPWGDEGNRQDGTLGTCGPNPDAAQSLASGSHPCHLSASRWLAVSLSVSVSLCLSVSLSLCLSLSLSLSLSLCFSVCVFRSLSQILRSLSLTCQPLFPSVYVCLQVFPLSLLPHPPPHPHPSAFSHSLSHISLSHLFPHPHPHPPQDLFFYFFILTPCPVLISLPLVPVWWHWPTFSLKVKE